MLVWCLDWLLELVVDELVLMVILVDMVFSLVNSERVLFIGSEFSVKMLKLWFLYLVIMVLSLGFVFFRWVLFWL